MTEQGSTPLESSGLSSRTLHALRRAGIETVEQVQVLGVEELCFIRNIGPKAIADIESAIGVLEDRTGNALPDDVRLSRLDLPVRVYRTLAQIGLLTIGDLRRRSTDVLLTLPGLDPSSIELLFRMLGHQPRREFGELNAGTAIHELELPSDLKIRLSQLGIAILADIVTCDLNVHLERQALSSRDLRYINRLRDRWSEQVEIRRVRLARSYGMDSLPPILSWINLLDAGYEWEAVSSLDSALKSGGLPALLPLPHSTLIGTPTVRYLLQIGCPLSQISSKRIVIGRVCRRVLAARELGNILRLFLADPSQLRESIDDYTRLESDVIFYAEWLGNQSDWKQEVKATSPSPVAMLHLHNRHLSDLVTSLMADVPTRDQEIIVMRLGLLEGKDHTLQGIAEQYSLTRERVRQICSKHLKEIQIKASGDELIQALLYFCQEVVDQHGVVQLDILLTEVADQLCVDTSGCSWVIPFLISESNRAQYSKTLGLLVSCRIPDLQIEALVASIKSILSTEKSPLRVDDFLQRREVQTQVEAIPFPHSRILSSCLQAASDFVEVENGYWALASWDIKLVDDIVMVLRKLGHPAHFREITELVNTRLGNGRFVNGGSVHAQLSRYQKLFMRTGPGQFGLREWDPDLPLQPPRYVDLIEGVLEEQGKPLTIDEIYNGVNAKRPAKITSISMYLQMDSRFCLLSGRRYGLRKWQNADGNNIEEELPEPEGGIQLPAEFLEQLKHRALQSLMSEQDSAALRGQP